MRRSHLEIYIEIISVLAQKGPLKLTPIMYKANLNCSVLKEDLNFLVKQGLVEERTIGKAKIVFAVTQRGINVLKYFRELKQSFQLLKKLETKLYPSRNAAFPQFCLKRPDFQELRNDFMILAEAIEFSKQFPSCHPKIFKGFVEWRSGNTETDGYVVLSDATLANESFLIKWKIILKVIN